MQSNYDELRDRVRLLDETLKTNRELEQQIKSLKNEFQILKESNINAQKYKNKKEEERLAYLENRELVEGTPTTARVGFWEFAASCGAIPKTAQVYQNEQARRLNAYGN